MGTGMGEATKPVGRIGVKSLLGGVGSKFEATKPVSQDWGKVVVGRYWLQVGSSQTCQPGLG